MPPVFCVWYPFICFVYWSHDIKCRIPWYLSLRTFAGVRINTWGISIRWKDSAGRLITLTSPYQIVFGHLTQSGAIVFGVVFIALVPYKQRRMPHSTSAWHLWNGLATAFQSHGTRATWKYKLSLTPTSVPQTAGYSHDLLHWTWWWWTSTYATRTSVEVKCSGDVSAV